MSKKQDYTVKADGWVAGKWCARGSTVSLTLAEAKYENVSLPSAQVGGAATEVIQKKPQEGEATASATEEPKRSRTKK